MENKLPASDGTVDKISTDYLPVITIVELMPQVPLEREAIEALHSMIHEASQFSGYQSAAIYKKVKDASAAEYAIILRFDSYRNLQLWNNSLIRKQKIASSKHFFAEVKPELALTGLEFWFVNKQSGTSAPVKWKMMMVTVVIIFVMLNTVMPLLGQFLEYFGLTGVIRTLISIVLMVSMMTYLIMPAINALLYRWLFPQKK